MIASAYLGFIGKSRLLYAVGYCIWRICTENINKWNFFTNVNQ